MQRMRENVGRQGSAGGAERSGRSRKTSLPTYNFILQILPRAVARGFLFALSEGCFRLLPSPHDICPDQRAVSQQRTFPPAALDFRQHIQRRMPVRANALKFRTVRREYFPGCRAAVLTGADRRKCLRSCPKSRAHGFLTDIQRTNRLAYATLFPASVPKKAFRPGIAGFAPRVVCSPPAGRVLPNDKDSLICPQQKSSRRVRELLIVKEITQERR